MNLACLVALCAQGPVLLARMGPRIAEQLDHTPAADVDRLAGDDTWRGRRPALCRFVLRINLAQLHAAADDLRWQALLLEQQADQLDALAALAS